MVVLRWITGVLLAVAAAFVVLGASFTTLVSQLDFGDGATPTSTDAVPPLVVGVVAALVGAAALKLLPVRHTTQVAVVFLVACVAILTIALVSGVLLR